MSSQIAARGVHLIELTDTIGMPFAIGRVRSHVSAEYEVDDLGRVLRETDALGRVTVNVVDLLGRKVKVTCGPDANPSIVYSTYDPGGHLILERAEWRDETGTSRPEIAVVKHYQYDQGNRLLSESVAPEQGGTKRIIRHRYDSEDNRRETINPRGGRTYFDYDGLNRQVRTVRAACSLDCSIATTSYDLPGHVLTQRSPQGAIYFNGHLDAGGVLQSGIDTRGRIRVRTDPLGHMVITDHDAMDKPTIVRQFQRRTDGQFEMLSRRLTDYDEHGDTVRVTDAIFEEPILTAEPVHAPDSEFAAVVNAGNVQSATNENHLDANGNIVAVRSPAGGVQRVRFDGQGRWYDQVDAEGRRTFRIHDGNGNVARVYAFEPVRDPASGNVLHYEVFLQGHDYNELNLEVGRVDSYGNRWRKHYDTLGNRTTTIDPLGNVVRYEHNAFGEEVDRAQERTVTGLGGDPPAPALITQHEYDQVGNVVAIIDPLKRRTEFTFDGLNRLTEARFAVGPNEPKELRTYDPADNLVSITDRNGIIRKMQYDLLIDISVRTSTPPAQPLETHCHHCQRPSPRTGTTRPEIKSNTRTIIVYVNSERFARSSYLGKNKTTKYCGGARPA